MKLRTYVVTESGFAADLGAEKFMDIICRYGGFAPSAVVITLHHARAQDARRACRSIRNCSRKRTTRRSPRAARTSPSRSRT